MSYNPKEYEEVKDRIARLYADYPEARIITRNLTTPTDREALTWVVQADIYLPMFKLTDDWKWAERPGDNWYLKASGLAFEIDGKNGMANKTSALENCETSAIGRALANAGYSGSRNRASAEEMAKVAKGITPSRDWIAEAKSAKSADELRKLYSDARRASVDNEVLATIADLAETWIEQNKKS